MSDVQALADRLRDELVDRYALTEVGNPYEPLVLVDSGERVGEVRVWTGDAVPKLLDSRLVVPDLGIDSTQLHVFAPSEGAVPHLGSDMAGLGDRVTFNVDLTPRADLAVEPAYLDAVYPPLTAARAQAYAIDGAEPVDLPLRLLAFSSPWIAGVTVGADQVAALESVYRAYVERFCDLLDEGAPQPGPLAPADAVARDRAHRRAQFDPSSDEVWDFLAGLLGRHAVDRILDLVREPGPPRA